MNRSSCGASASHVSDQCHRYFHGSISVCRGSIAHTPVPIHRILKATSSFSMAGHATSGLTRQALPMRSLIAAQASSTSPSQPLSPEISPSPAAATLQRGAGSARLPAPPSSPSTEGSLSPGCAEEVDPSNPVPGWDTAQLALGGDLQTLIQVRENT